MSGAEKVRAALAEADRELGIAAAADSMRNDIRLFNFPVRDKRNWLAFRNFFHKEAEPRPLTRPQVDAIYRALGVVEREARASADAITHRLEATR